MFSTLDAVTVMPVLGGLLLMVGCFVLLFRNPKFFDPGSSTALLALGPLLALGAIMFAVPLLSNLTFKGGQVEISLQVQTGEKNVAEIKGKLADVTSELQIIHKIADGLAKATSVPVPVVAPPAEVQARRKSVVVIVYSDNQRKLASTLEQRLLQAGFSANAVFSDYKELAEDQKGKPDSVRFVYNDPAVAEAVKAIVKPEVSGLEGLADKTKQASASDLRILLF